MVEIYVSLVIKELRTIDKVPSGIRQKVKDMLIELGHSELAEEK